MWLGAGSVYHEALASLGEREMRVLRRHVKVRGRVAGFKNRAHSCDPASWMTRLGLVLIETNCCFYPTDMVIHHVQPHGVTSLISRWVSVSL